MTSNEAAAVATLRTCTARGTVTVTDDTVNHRYQAACAACAFTSSRTYHDPHSAVDAQYIVVTDAARHAACCCTPPARSGDPS